MKLKGIIIFLVSCFISISLAKPTNTNNVLDDMLKVVQQYHKDVNQIFGAKKQSPSIYEINMKNHINKEKHGKDIWQEVDELITESQKAIEDYDNQNVLPRDAIIDAAHHWPGAGTGRVRIPYTIDVQILDNRKKMQAIEIALGNFKNRTCITFHRVDDSSKDHKIKFINDRGCYSYVGYVFIKDCLNCQPVSIGDGCGASGIVEHELMHAIGFYHEQARPDRDDYVDIRLQNLLSPMFKSQFKKQHAVNYYGENYDVKSVMHYGGNYFAKPGTYTIVIKDTDDPVVANRFGFAKSDISQINAMYCGGNGVNNGNHGNTNEALLTTGKEMKLRTHRACAELVALGFCQFKWACDLCRDQCGEGQKLKVKDINSKEECEAWKRKGRCKSTSEFHKVTLEKCLRTCLHD